MIQSHKRKVGITFTAGIDSTVLLYWFCKNDGMLNYLSPTPYPEGMLTEVHLVIQNHGQKTYSKTLKLANKHLEFLEKTYKNTHKFVFHKVDCPLPSWVDVKNGLLQEGFVPNEAEEKIHYEESKRDNQHSFIDGLYAMMFTQLLSWASHTKIPILLTGHQLETQEWDSCDSYRHRVADSGPFFIDRMNLVAEQGYQFRTRIEAPFCTLRLSKYEIVKLGIDLGIDLGKDTYSCVFTPECGKCDNCIITRKAFAIHGISR